MPVNNFKPFAIDPSANVATQAEFEALPALTSGFQSGIARSEQLNKVWRQSSVVASALAQFIVNQANVDMLDNGTTANIIANLKLAIQSVILEYAYAPLASPVLTGTPKAPTAAGTSNDTTIASSAFVKNALASYAPLASPAFSGTPSASTPAGGDNTGKLATTGFVANALSSAGTIYTPTFGGLSLSGVPGNGQLRIAFGGYGAMFLNDGGSLYILLTANNNPNGGYNGLRPFSINLANGAVTIDATSAGTNFGASPTAPTPAAADNSARLATTSWVRQQDYATNGYLNSTFWPATTVDSLFYRRDQFQQSLASNGYRPA